MLQRITLSLRRLAPDIGSLGHSLGLTAGTLFSAAGQPSRRLAVSTGKQPGYPSPFGDLGASRYLSNRSNLFWLEFSLVAAIGMTALARPNHPPIPIPTPTPTLSGFGGALPGLSTKQAASFAAGQAQFEVVDGPADGLGPIFNGQSCFQCHTQPDANGAGIPGGASAVTETRFGTSSGSFDLLHQASLNPSVQDGVPIDAVIVAHRKTTPLFGLGLIENIPDAAIKANVHNPAVDGVTGRPAVLSDAVTTAIAAGGIGPSNFVGRFGWKCQESTLLAFSGDAYLNETGVTNRFFTTDLMPYALSAEPPNYALMVAAEPLGYSLATPYTPTTQLTPTTLQDLPANPVLPEGPNNPDDIASFTNFMELTSPPPTLPLTRQSLQGQQLFTQINCVACHVANMRTGSSNVSAALTFKNVPLYSDLLLHHMGNLGDGIVQAAAAADEIRTAPLWGLRARSPFLHDGRASTVLEAILLHDGEARTIRDRFANLTEAQQQAIIAFLNSI